MSDELKLKNAQLVEMIQKLQQENSNLRRQVADKDTPGDFDVVMRTIVKLCDEIDDDMGRSHPVSDHVQQIRDLCSKRVNVSRKYDIS